MNNIKTARLAAGLTQQAMSEKMGIPKRTIENWEQGSRSCPEWAERLIIKELNNMITVKLTQSPYLRGGEIRDGIHALTEWYEALGKGAEGNEYNVVWQIINAEANEENVCDWNNPWRVFALDDNNKDVSENAVIKF